MSGHGGNRKGAGAPTGPRTDNVKLGISISRKNAEWLRNKPQGVSWLIDKAIAGMRKCDKCSDETDCVFKASVFDDCLVDLGLL